MHGGDARGIRDAVLRLGYTGGGIFSFAVGCGDSVGGNEAVRQALQVFPENSFWGKASFDPCHYSQEELEEMIPALYADKRFKGCKPYKYVPRYDDPLYDVWWRYADEHRLMAVLDRNRWGTDFSEIENLAGKYPNVSWIVPHCGAKFSYAEAGIQCARGHPNVYLDITYTSVLSGMIEFLVEGAGEDRVLYASDLPMRDPRQQLGWVVFSRLPAAVKPKVLGGNALRLVGKVRP